MFKLFIASLILLSACTVYGQENRTFSGENNNLVQLEWGAVNSPLLRKSSVQYVDNYSEVQNTDLPTPRHISNHIFAQQENIFDTHNLSDYVWLFGQFIDHDITLVESDNRESIFLEIPEDDEYFSSSDFILTSRNQAIPGTGTGPNNPRQYANHVSSYLDGSAIYGSDRMRAEWLRDMSGDGKLKVSEGDLLPWNTIDGEFDSEILSTAPTMADDTRSLSKYYIAGDIRANENPLLIGLHTLFVREHNRLCDVLRMDHPNWTGDQIYQRARKYVGAYLQNITYNEWLPAMGVILPEYNGYREEVNPAIINSFSAAAFRIGHTLINSNLIRMGNDGEELATGNIRLKDAFFNPLIIEISGGIEPFFKGMGTQVMQELDCKMIDDLRNFLFGAPGAGGLDLASVNIFRGRDRGLSNYNQLRFDFGLPKVSNISDFAATPEDEELLSEMYSSVDNIDAWVGMLAERHKNDAIFGELVMRIIEEQFKSLRDGDRFYFENDPVFTPSDVDYIKTINLHKILMRNTGLGTMQTNLFVAMPHAQIPTGPEIGKEPLSSVAYPNPVIDHTYIKLYSEQDQTVSFQIFDAHGRTVSTVDKVLFSGDNTVRLEMDPSWPLGVYNILVSTPEQYAIHKIIKE